MDDLIYTNLGSVKYKDKMLDLSQVPYFVPGRNAMGGMFDAFVALAQDAEGNEYKVLWPVVRPDAEDDADLCDWETNYAVGRV